jgi:hypothetical protein
MSKKIYRYESLNNNGSNSIIYLDDNFQIQGEYKLWFPEDYYIHKYYKDNQSFKLTFNRKCALLKLKNNLLRKVRFKKYVRPLLSNVLIKDLVLLCISYI